MRSGILLVHPGALGDVLIALGLAARLQGRLTVAVRGAILRLAPLVPHVAEWLDLDSAWGPALLSGQVAAWPAPLRESSAAFLLRSDPDGAIAQQSSRDLGAPVVVGSAIPPSGCSAHRHVARLLGVSQEPLGRPWVSVPGPPGEAAPVVIHPGSGGRAKRWPLDGFVEVARILERRIRPVKWLLGDAEVEDGLDRTLTGDVMRALSLDEVARVLATAGAFLGNDSGVAHLAAAVGTPSVLIFGPTAPESWAPAVRWVAAVRGDPRADATRWSLDPERIAGLVRAAARG